MIAKSSSASRSALVVMRSRILARACLLLAAMAGLCLSSLAQTSEACTGDGYRVVGQHWDAVLKTGWEYRQACSHPDWPARLFVLASLTGGPATTPSQTPIPVKSAEPLLVRAGDVVRLWMQDGTVRIEMSGVAERSARMGESIAVRVDRHTDDATLSVQHIPGVVRGPEDVEMER